MTLSFSPVLLSDHIWSPEYMWSYMYIYMCMCVYCHWQTDCFVESKHVNVARHARCLKLGSKHGWLYASQIFYRTATKKLGEGTLTHMYHFCFDSTYTLNGSRELNLLEEFCMLSNNKYKKLRHWNCVLTKNRTLSCHKISRDLYIYIYKLVVHKRLYRQKIKGISSKRVQNNSKEIKNCEGPFVRFCSCKVPEEQ